MRLNKIFDSQETASIKEARKLLVEKAGMTDEQADKWVRGDLRAAFPILRDKKAAKFILGTTRLFAEHQLNGADVQNKMSRILKEINEVYYDEFDRNLNGKSLSELYSMFEQSFKDADRATRELSSSKSFGESNYKIYGSYDSFKQAKKAWGDKSQDWCVFHREDMYDNYTSAGQRFYVAAQNGWKHIKRVAGKDAPKDEYGNSLIAISVDEYGNLATSTPRWNHDNGGGDNTYTVDELEDIIQMPFYDTFKPYTVEQLRERGIVSFKDAAERLASGEDPHDIFDSVNDFHEGFALVRLNDKCNFISTKSNFLSTQWFDNAGSFSEGFACVRLNGKSNFIDTKGNFLSNRWFDFTEDFRNGFACVHLNNKYNFVDTKGNFLSDQWFDDAGNFHEGFAPVQLKDKWNFIDTQGNLLSSQWFDSTCAFYKGFAIVRLKGKSNFINAEGNFLSDQWFDDVELFRDGFADVKLNGEWHHIDKTGKIVDSRVSNLNLKRLSKLMDATKRQREMIRSWAEKANKNADEIISWAESNFKNDNEQLAAAKWWIDGYPTNTFKQALYICGQKKMDPLKQDPEKLVNENPDVKPKEKPINPDDVLTDKQDEGDGITTYAARDEDRQVIREILNTHFGKDASPWCLLQSDGNGRLTSSSADYWKHYNAYPKRIAFMKGRLLAFSAGSNPKVREWWDRFDRSFPFIPYNGKVWVGKSGDTFEIKKGEVFKTSADNSYRALLSNRYSENIEESFDDVSYNSTNNSIYLDDTRYPVASQDDKYYYIDCPKLKGKVDKETLTPEGDFTYFFHDGEEGLKEVSRQCTYKNSVLNGIDKSFYFGGGIRSECTYVNGKKNGPFISYNSDGVITSKSMFKNGNQEGLQLTYHDNGQLESSKTYVNGQLEGESVSYFEDGQLYTKCTYKNGERQGLYERYSSNGNIRERCNFVDDERDGLFQAFRSDGTLEREGEYKGGQKDGKHVEYYDNGMVIEECNYHNGQLHGDRITRYFNGNVKLKCHYVDGKYDGEYAMFTREGLPEKLCHFKNGRLEGEFIEYLDGKPCTKYNNKDGYKDGLLTQYFPNGNVDYICTYKEGLKEGPTTFYYPNGNVHKLINYHNDQMDGESVVYREDGDIKSIVNFVNGDREGRARRYYESGALYLDCTYKDGEMDGWCITYYEDGSIASKAMYNEGEEVSSKHFEQGERKP